MLADDSITPDHLSPDVAARTEIKSVDEVPKPDVPDHILLQRHAQDAWSDSVKAWNDLVQGNVQWPTVPETFDPSPFMQSGIPVNPVVIR